MGKKIAKNAVKAASMAREMATIAGEAEAPAGNTLNGAVQRKIKTVEKIRAPVEDLHAEELAALVENDTYPKPENWHMSPRMVELFILGTDEKFPRTKDGKKQKISITPKFFGDRSMIQKAIVTLASERSLMLLGEPGTAKSWLSEHLSAAISGLSTYLIQGTAGTTEDQIRYSWNYAMLVSEGPSPAALVPSPTINAMRTGKLLRFEELTRCSQEIQDCLISILSEKVIPVPELGSEYLIFGKPGFNVIATANDRDRGVNEMSAALKRRFNFVYVPVIKDKELEKKIVLQRTSQILERTGFEVQIAPETIDVLVSAFQEMRTGRVDDGGRFQTIGSVMSTSEEISVLLDSALHGVFFGKGVIDARIMASSLIDVVIKDDRENMAKMEEYIDLVARGRGNTSTTWQEFHHACKQRLQEKRRETT